MVPLHGTVRMVDHERGYGFVETVEGEVKQCDRGRVRRIEPGSKVRLEVDERESDDGWQATTVRLIGKYQVQDLTA